MGERTRELLILILGDIACFNIALWLMLLVRYAEIPTMTRWVAHLGPFLWMSGIWIFLFLSAGLYDKHTTLLKQVLRNKIIYVQVANMIIAGFLFLVVPFGVAPKTNLLIYLVISTVLLSWWRLKLFNYFSPKGTQKAILIADGKEAIELVDEINNNERYNYSFVRIIDATTAKDTPDFESKLLELIEQEHITIVVASAYSQHTAKILPAIFDLSFLHFRLTYLDFTKLYEDTFDKVPVSSLRYEWFIDHVSQSQSVVYDVSKKLMDILGALLLLIPCVIIFPIVALYIKHTRTTFHVK